MNKIIEQKFCGKYRVQSARLQNYDYGQDGAYFITICAHNREHFFGTIGDDVIKRQKQKYTIKYSEIGNITKKYWLEIPRHYPFVFLGPWVIMPNHIHGILIFNRNNINRNCRDAKSCVST